MTRKHRYNNKRNNALLTLRLLNQDNDGTCLLHKLSWENPSAIKQIQTTSSLKQHLPKPCLVCRFVSTSSTCQGFFDAGWAAWWSPKEGASFGWCSGIVPRRQVILQSQPLYWWCLNRMLLNQNAMVLIRRCRNLTLRNATATFTTKLMRPKLDSPYKCRNRASMLRK